MHTKEIQRQLKKMAMLDAGMCQEWQYRYFNHDSGWGNGDQMASMRNGCGSHWFVLFDSGGCVYKILDKDKAGKIDEFNRLFPKDTFFVDFMDEPAFSTKDISQIGHLI